MRRAVPLVGFAAVVASFDATRPEPVGAHGPPPAALAILAADAGGPELVRLSDGLAWRERGGTYRFVCPAAWDDEVVLAAASIPGGPPVVAGRRGLYVLDRASRAVAHPDPEARGPILELVAFDGRLFGLRVRGGEAAVLEIRERRARVVFEEPVAWGTMTATDAALGLQRLDGDRLEQVQLAGDGTELERASVAAPEGAFLVTARAAGASLYAVVSSARGRELGRIESGAWTTLEVAVASIAGPIEGGAGVPFAAIDGELVAQFGSDSREVLRGMTRVQCLGRFDAEAYACTLAGLSRIDGSGVGEPLFELSSLSGPDSSGLSSVAGDACRLQWEHFRFDLLALGISLAPPAAPEDAPDAGEAPQPSAATAERAAGGCTLGVGGRSLGGGGWGGVGVVGLWLGLRVRARPRRSSLGI